MITLSIITILIAWLFIYLAGYSNANMDIVSHNIGGSIYADKNPWYYDPKVSWRSKYINNDPSLGRKTWYIDFYLFKIASQHPYFSDFWHQQKSHMVVAFILATGFFGVHCWLLTIAINYLHPFMSLMFILWVISNICIMGVIFNKTFMLFYTKILRKK